MWESQAGSWLSQAGSWLSQGPPSHWHKSLWELPAPVSLFQEPGPASLHPDKDPNDVQRTQCHSRDFPTCPCGAFHGDIPSVPSKGRESQTNSLKEWLGHSKVSWAAVPKVLGENSKFLGIFPDRHISGCAGAIPESAKPPGQEGGEGLRNHPGRSTWALLSLDTSKHQGLLSVSRRERAEGQTDSIPTATESAGWQFQRGDAAGAAQSGGISLQSNTGTAGRSPSALFNWNSFSKDQFLCPQLSSFVRPEKSRKRPEGKLQNLPDSHLLPPV